MKEKYIIGVDFGGTNIKIAIFDKKYKIVANQVLSTANTKTRRIIYGNTTGADSAGLIQAIINAIKHMIQNKGIDKKQVLGIGIGVPGPIDINKGIIHFLPNVPGYKDIKLVDMLKRSLGINAFMDNDANLFTLSETLLGAAKGYSNVVGITLGTGVGGGLVLSDKLYRGSKFMAGEIGHIPIAMHGRKCNCGNRGCLEAYIGNQRILQQAKRVFKKSLGLEELSHLAKKGNADAIRIWQGVGGLLGFALTGVVNLLNPDAIVIGGGVAKAGKVLFDSIRNTIRGCAMPKQARQVKVLNSKFGQNAGLIGAALLVDSFYSGGNL